MNRTHPKVENAPGIIWRPSGEGWEARWQARTDLILKGFKPKSQRLWTGVEPTITEAAAISDTCRRLQDEMLIWGRGGVPVANVYDGTIRSLVNCYQINPYSRWHKKRYQTRLNHLTLLKRIVTRHGHEVVRDIKGTAIMDWDQEWSDGGRMLATGQIMRGILRVLFSFGFAILEDPECERLCNVMGELTFEAPGSRKEALTADQAVAVRKFAREHCGWNCIAFAQALQFELILRQRDVIGEYVPLSEKGTSDVIFRNKKWLRGLRWSEVNANLILTHTTSKRGKEIEVDLKLAPMVMEELQLIAGDQPLVVVDEATKKVTVYRDLLPATGPMIRSTISGMPYPHTEFRRKWRIVANLAGVPKTVFNMDSRAGGITEAAEYGAPKGDIQNAATHSTAAMTEKYIRGRVAAEARSNVARIRVEGRNKPKTE